MNCYMLDLISYVIGNQNVHVNSESGYLDCESVETQE